MSTVNTRQRLGVSTHVNGQTWIDLYVTDCPACCVVFAITTELEDRRRADGQTLWCPNGHKMSWNETEADRERKARRRAEREAERLRIAHQAALDQAQTAERRRRAAKGQLTKTKRRIAAGVCPCCNRTFQDLGRHMAGQHPDYAPTTESVVEVVGPDDQPTT